MLVSSFLPAVLIDFNWAGATPSAEKGVPTQFHVAAFLHNIVKSFRLVWLRHLTNWNRWLERVHKCWRVSAGIWTGNHHPHHPHHISSSSSSSSSYIVIIIKYQHCFWTCESASVDCKHAILHVLWWPRNYGFKTWKYWHFEGFLYCSVTFEKFKICPLRRRLT